MDIILKKAERFADGFFIHSVLQYEELLNVAKMEAAGFDSRADKIKYLNFLLERNNKDYASHKEVCKDLVNCQFNFAYENIAFYLSQELKKLGVYFNDDTFSEEERQRVESKLDQILKDFDEIKLGQQVIYEDLMKEMNELKELFFLGKKKWYQMFLGKCIDMVASGVVSETISKQIVEKFKKTVPFLDGN